VVSVGLMLEGWMVEDMGLGIEEGESSKGRKMGKEEGIFSGEH